MGEQVDAGYQGASSAADAPPPHMLVVHACGEAGAARGGGGGTAQFSMPAVGAGRVSVMLVAGSGPAAGPPLQPFSWNKVTRRART